MSVTSWYAMQELAAVVQIQPRKRVLGHSDHPVLIRQRDFRPFKSLDQALCPDFHR